MTRFAYSYPRALLFAFLLFFPTNPIKMSLIPNVPILNKDLIVSKKQLLSVSNKERKPSTRTKVLGWEKKVKSFYGNSMVQLDGFAKSKYDVYREFYEALYHLSEDKKPGSGNEVINKYVKLLMDENEELEHENRRVWELYKEEKKIMSEKINQATKAFESDALKNEKVMIAKVSFEQKIYGPGGIFDYYKEKRASIFRERSYKALEIFDKYELEVEELFAYYNERWQEEYGLRIVEDRLYDIKIQTLENIPNFYLSYTVSEFDLFLESH